MEVKITMEKFMELVKRTAKLKIGRSATIEESTIAKNNELIYQGTEAMIHGNRIHRSAYLEQFYGFFDHDADLRECIGKMIRVDVKPETITESNSIFRDMSDWEKMRPRVCCQIINRARNLKLLRKVSNTEYLHLAVVYSLEFKEYGPYIYSVRVTKKMLEQMNVSMEELHEQALINMKRKFPYKIEPLEAIILNQTAFDREHIPDGDQLNLPVYVIQNRLEADGAAVILDQEPFEMLAHQLGTNLLVLPTSVHELIAMPEMPDETVKNMKTLLMKINLECVKTEEQLSPHVYRYDREKREMEIVD